MRTTIKELLKQKYEGKFKIVELIDIDVYKSDEDFYKKNFIYKFDF